MVRSAIVLACVFLASGGARAASPFDGSWSVSQTCPPTNGDVQGFSWSYRASVRNGVFTGIKTSNNANDGAMRLTGRIDSNGDATLTASGKAGAPAYNVHHEARGYPIHYAMSAHFTADSGTGTRTQQRPCDFKFTKN